MIESEKISFSWKGWCLSWVPFFAVTFLVVKGAVMPPSEIPDVFLQLNDKVVHFGEYLVLFFASHNAFRKAQAVFLKRQPVLAAIFYGLLLGVITELLQRSAPGRSAEAADWAADAAGTIIAPLFFEIRKKLQ